MRPQPGGKQVVVEHVTPGGPGARAGLLALDFIYRIDGKELNGVPSAINTIQGVAPGGELTFDIRRGGNDMVLKVKVDAAPLRLLLQLE